MVRAIEETQTKANANPVTLRLVNTPLQVDETTPVLVGPLKNPDLTVPTSENSLGRVRQNVDLEPEAVRDLAEICGYFWTEKDSLEYRTTSQQNVLAERIMRDFLYQALESHGYMGTSILSKMEFDESIPKKPQLKSEWVVVKKQSNEGLFELISLLEKKGFTARYTSIPNQDEHLLLTVSYQFKD